MDNTSISENLLQQMIRHLFLCLPVGIGILFYLPFFIFGPIFEIYISLDSSSLTDQK